MNWFHWRSSRSLVILCFAFLSIAIAGLYLVAKPFPSTSVAPSAASVVFCEESEACHTANLPYQNPVLSQEARVADLLSRMTTAEKVGQMALIEKNSVTDLNDIAKYGLGALLSGGGANPEPNTPEGWFQMVSLFQKHNQKTRLGIPLLYGVDAIHGHGSVAGATIFPHQIGLGATHNPDLVREVAKATASEVAATGVNWVFSPDVDVVQDMRWGRTYETFGSNPALVGSLGRATIEGLQTPSPTGRTIVATAKHFVGNGSTKWGSSTNKDYFIDQGISTLSETELRQTHLEPFRQAVSANVKSIMVGLHTWQGEKMSSNTHLITDTLKQELGFKGFVVSDWYGVYEQEPDTYRALVTAINAGVDMVMLPFDYKVFSAHMQRALENGDIRPARIDDAVSRILKVKFEAGLFESVVTDASHLTMVGSASHRELARRAVRESLVVLKDANVLPISPKAQQILVSGSAANNIGRQSGGWTVEWQGIDGNWIPGTTVLKGIQDAASSSARVDYDPQGMFINQKGIADVAIAVVGETPYAEGRGDQQDLKLSTEDLATIARLKKISKKIVVIIVSGRPLKIQADAKDWDAIIAAWLPGSEGAGVADVLFGNQPFTGILPVVWELYPRNRESHTLSP